MTDTDFYLRIALQGNVPQELTSEIERMRRNPADFWLRGRAACSLGCDRKGQRSAYQLGYKEITEAGTWCPTHGWLTFNSADILPTERLTPAELEDRRLSQQRKRGPRQPATI